MKKLLLTLVAAIAFCGSTFAQQYDSHWQVENFNEYNLQAPFCAGIIIDGVYIETTTNGWNALEVAAFVGDGDNLVLRGNNMYLNDELVLEWGDPYPIIIGAPIYYTNAGEQITFKMYDHAKGIEYTDYTIVLYDGSPYAGENGPYVFTGEHHWEGYDWYEDGLFLSFTSPATTSLTKTITGYGNAEENPKGNYYLIANPFEAAMELDEVNGLVTDHYDLYSFDQGEENEWRTGVTAMAPGTGYLYASATTTTLTFTGTPITETSVEKDLVYNANAVDFPGYNLLGNPFAQAVYVNMPFYTLDGAEYVGHDANTQVAEMAGLFVIADPDHTSVQFSTTAQTKSSNLSLNVMKNNGMVDRAIVSFNGNSQLPKFQFNSDNTKLYIPMEGKDYAVVSCEEMGELPVNFRASANGAYTLNVTSSEVSFAYLHLIDNLTGIETDLLANPSYSFEAKTTDYESRFRLVFATGNADDAFAFFSNGSFVINNEGNATLQVIDVNGRILSSETINGCANVNVNAATGVYMIRLINGDNVKVQKVVIK